MARCETYRPRLHGGVSGLGAGDEPGVQQPGREPREVTGRGTRLQHQHTATGVLTEQRREDGAAAPGTHHDDVGPTGGVFHGRATERMTVHGCGLTSR
jgi:hypothetical protein